MRSLGFVQQRETRRVWILFLTVGLHVAVLYAVLQKTGRQAPRAVFDNNDRVSLYFFKPIKPIDKPESKEATPQSPIASPARRTVAPDVDLSPPAPSASPLPAESAAPQPGQGQKPLNLVEILKGVGPDVAKYDREHPGEKSLPGERLPPSLQARLDRIFAEGTAPPKWYEGARVEEISSGAQLDAGVRIYKIITFAGSYCVTYTPDAPPVKSLCTKF